MTPVIALIQSLLSAFIESMQSRESSTTVRQAAEVMLGLQNYFDRCLPQILLYRFEKPQYQQQQAAANNSGNSSSNRHSSSTTNRKIERDHAIHSLSSNLSSSFFSSSSSPSSLYGVEHLLRLFIKLHDILPSAKISEKEEKIINKQISNLIKWISVNEASLFTAVYTPTDKDYLALVGEFKEQTVNNAMSITG